MMMTDSYLYLVVALLPLAAIMVVLQEDPYHALVIRGILGAIAAMSYAVLGAADVALTEALVGTLLAITLYAIAVRSSLVMRLGILKEQSSSQPCPGLAEITEHLRPILQQYHLRLEVLPYNNLLALRRALRDREVHGICDASLADEPGLYHLMIRVDRLYEIIQKKPLPPQITHLSCVDISQLRLPGSPVSDIQSPDTLESR